MDRLLEFLERVRENGLSTGRLRGVLHIAIGRTVKTDDGTVVSSGTTWRDLSHQLKAAKYDKELVREIGADPDDISPRDRERFWYSVIALARPDSIEAIAEAESLIPLLVKHGYVVGPAPVGLVASALPAPVPAKQKAAASKTMKARKK